MELAPLIIFCFNRPRHSTETIEALKKNKLASETDLFIFSDGARNTAEEVLVNEVRSIINSVTGFKSVKVVERSKNMGLANSIITGVSEIISKYKKVIVMEDDLICSESFLENKNKMLDYFESHKHIFSTSGFCPPVSFPDDFKDDLFLYPRTSSLGWGTWIDRWESIDWSLDNFKSFIQSKEQRQHFNKGGIDLTPMLLHQKTGKINSWAIRFCYAASLQNKLCVYPKESMLYHIGDDTGTHSHTTTDYGDTASDKLISITSMPEENPAVTNIIRNFWANSYIRRLINFCKRLAYLFIVKL